KKTERLAKAIHLVAPAFRNSQALRERLDRIAVALVDAAILPPASARDAFSRELLALSSVLSIGRTGGLLSAMNADLIAREAQSLLQEIAAYEAPRLFLDDVPSLAELSKEAATPTPRRIASAPAAKPAATSKGQSKGHILDKPAERTTERREAILSVLRGK